MAQRPPPAERALEPREWPEYDPYPSYWEMLQYIQQTFAKEWVNRASSNYWVQDFANDWSSLSAVGLQDMWRILIVAFVFTLLRSQLNAWVLKPLAASLRIRRADYQKFPEGMFKFTYYSITVSYATYILFGMGETYFGDPALIWKGWSSRMPIQPETYGLYILQMGFYVHAVYGVLVLDARRKDTFVMVLHHILTLLLMGFSLAVRTHRIGVVVLFIHDIEDIFLEGGKLAMILRYRGKSFDQICDHISTLCFVLFMVSWFTLRLVLFFRYVLYVSGHMLIVIVPNGPFYGFFNFLLFSLYLMNIYWFQFILLAAVKILGGTRIQDTREEDSDDDDEDADGADHDVSAAKDVKEAMPGQSARQTTNRRTRASKDK